LTLIHGSLSEPRASVLSWDNSTPDRADGPVEHEFGARLSTVSWVAIVYLLVMAAFFADLRPCGGHVRAQAFVHGGFLLFVLGSALCGFAPNLPALIACRVLQAIGAALLSSNSVASIDPTTTLKGGVLARRLRTDYFRFVGLAPRRSAQVLSFGNARQAIEIARAPFGRFFPNAR
jgi:MFS family permease